MRILQSSWLDPRGLKIHVQAWEPETRPKAVVGILHGLGEHIARYAPVAEALVRAGFAAMGPDLRGHGRSQGRRGHTPSYEALLDDVQELLDRIADRYPRLPVFLFGHSLGGALAINFALRRSAHITGVIATAPWFREVVKSSPLRIALARMLNPILPTYTERWAAEPEALSHDRAVGEAYEHDPLVHSFITARMYVEFRAAGEWAMEHAAELPVPLLLMHGTEDRFTSWEASREFAHRPGQNVTWRPLKGWYHELHNEPRRSQLVRTMVAWMKARLENPPAPRRSAGQMRPRMRKSRTIRAKGA